MLCPKAKGTPRMPTVLPAPGSSSMFVLFESPTILQSQTSRLPLECHFRKRGVGIGAVIDRLDHETHPFRPHRSDIGLLTVHAIRESNLARAAIRKLRGHGGQ